MASRFDALMQGRRERRLADALAGAEEVLARLTEAGFDAAVVGSLARRAFRAHSDVDVLVRGDLGTSRRLEAETIVAERVHGRSIGFDLVFANDFAEDLRRALDIEARDLGALRAGSPLPSPTTRGEGRTGNHSPAR
jgi:predicted nucleotidyltransferase